MHVRSIVLAGVVAAVVLTVPGASAVSPDCRSELPSVRGITFTATSCDRGGTPSKGVLTAFRQAEHIKAGTPYTASLINIGGNDARELIIELESGEWCGTGGCTVFVYAPVARRELARIPTARIPLVVSSAAHNGWHDLIIRRSGGGFGTSYTRTTFGTKRYPAGSSHELADDTPVDGRVLLATATHTATGKLP